MESCKLVTSVGMLSVGISIFGNVGYAQDVSLAGFAKVYQADGLYEHNRDGVPVLGFVTERLANGRAKFTMCNNTTTEVAFRELKRSHAICPSKYKDPGIWTVASKTIIPVIKARSSSKVMLLKSEGKDIDVSTLPFSYIDAISNAKTGDSVGFVFTGEDGKKSIGILTNTSK